MKEAVSGREQHAMLPVQGLLHDAVDEHCATMDRHVACDFAFAPLLLPFDVLLVSYQQPLRRQFGIFTRYTLRQLTFHNTTSMSMPNQVVYVGSLVRFHSKHACIAAQHCGNAVAATLTGGRLRQHDACVCGAHSFSKMS